jgi:16S rRNA processing protein RimM
MPLVRVGRLLKPHGVQGFVRCEVTTDHPELLASGRSYSLLDPRTDELIRVESPELEYTPGATSFLLRIPGWTEPEPLRAFQDWELVYVAQRGELPREEGVVYYFELAGLEVRDTAGEVIGHVVELVETGAGLLLELDTKPPRLIPYTARDVTEVNLNGGYLVTTYGEAGHEDVR